MVATVEDGRVTKLRPDNLFAPALDADSDAGERITKNEFIQAIAAVAGPGGRLTGALVQRIRQDWDALAQGGVHPATPEARETYRAFVIRYGTLELLELLAA